MRIVHMYINTEFAQKTRSANIKNKKKETKLGMLCISLNISYFFYVN